ncbi:MAG: type III polyketide synthase [Hyphomicrobiales bacterium]|nr:type III polyketide synthase [Hyphomicrobiales bacterium]
MLERVLERQENPDCNTDPDDLTGVTIDSIASSVPQHRIPQDLAQSLATRIFGKRYPDFCRLVGTFENAGIQSRYSVCPSDWFMEERSWPERAECYLRGAVSLYRDVASKALLASGHDASEIDFLVTVSSTGVATPTLEARVLAEMGFRRDVKRVPLFGLGCAGGVSGLSIATRLAQSEPGAKVLFVCLELCTLSFRSDRLRKADIIAAALFGDGAAAACLSADGGSACQIVAGAEYTWPDTLNMMGWDVDDVGLGVIFDRSIPAFVTENLPPALNYCLDVMGTDRRSIARFVCHPGGAKVVDAIETSMKLEPGCLDVERDVLRDFGNMSAPTVLFVLERVLRNGVSGNLVLTALGPGFTLSTLQVRCDG